MITVARKNAFGVWTATAISLSAFLLFVVEPLVAKRILPWFGGSAAVWSTCLVFYQTALLVGYLYARLVTRYLSPRAQAGAHIAILLASLALLPIGPANHWKNAVWSEPAWQILYMLTATIGLPFVALSATSPLLQSWLARRGDEAPYWLFAVSNFFSLIALLAYPVAIEPNLNLSRQSVDWSVLFVLFASICVAVSWQSRTTVEIAPAIAPAEPDHAAVLAPLYWFCLAACGSMLLLSVTNHMTENVAAVPLLWVLPLAVYLLSFVLSFGLPGLYQRSLWLRLLAFALGIIGYAIYSIDTIEAIQVSVPIYLAGLFIGCMFCHAELRRLRPGASGLTGFYLMIAFGGAAGAIFVGLIAPHLFSGIYELPLTLCFTALLALLLVWRGGAWAIRLLWVGVAGCMAAVFVMNVHAYRQNSLSLRRSFYGSLRVVQSPRAGPEQIRTLFHGTIRHGAEYLWPDRRMKPITYYGPDSGVAIVLRECFPSPKRVGVIGLGTGTLAAFGQAGDTFRFYEINSQVIEIAQSLFFFTRETPARVEIVEGDARLSLQRESVPPFDVLALDAFSGDAIPVHLLTREAVALYLRRIKPDGVLAFHVSNNYLDLAPVVAQLAQEIHYRAIEVKNHADPDDSILPAEWVLVTRNTSVLENTAIRLHSQPITPRPGLRPWTDDFNNLLEILKTPRLN
jgi:SAM-dependent methyltransferase